MSYKVTKLTDPVSLGEGPHWDHRVKSLYFVSLFDHTINKLHLSTGKHTRTKLDDEPGFIIPLESSTDKFLVGCGRKFVVVQWDGEEGSQPELIEELTEVDQGKKTSLNDGKCDPRGRIFSGTKLFEGPSSMNSANKQGSLYRIDGKTPKKLADGIGISNGLAWDIQRKTFYYTDSLEYKVRKYDFNVDTGEISNQQYFFDLKANNIEGLPDGSTIDTDGNLYVAVFGGPGIIKIDPNGKLVQKIVLPGVKQVTSVTWGGDNLDILFVTTAYCNIEGGKPLEPPNGSVFMVTGLGAKGLPNVNCKL